MLGKRNIPDSAACIKDFENDEVGGDMSYIISERQYKRQLIQSSGIKLTPDWH